MIFLFQSFLINYILSFSLVGFELFGLRVQVYTQLVQFTLGRKGHDTHHCHNKPKTGNETGMWMTSFAEEMGWEFGRFWKRFSWGPTMVLKSLSLTIQLKVDFGPCRQTIEFLPLGQGIEFSAIEWSFLPLQRRLSFAGPDQRRWIEI